MNQYKTEGDKTYLYLRNVDQWTIIDTEDLEKIKKCTWYGKKGKWDQYARGMINGKEIKLHRLIMGVTDPKKHVDHKNGNTYDNRKENLRIVTNSENHMNQKLRKDNKLGIKGVCYRDKKYICRISKGEYHYNKTFETKEEAVKEYNKKAKELFGEYAKFSELEEEEDNGYDYR